MSVGRCQRIGVPAGTSFFFLDLARPVSIEVRLSSNARSTSIRSFFDLYIAFSAARSAAWGLLRERGDSSDYCCSVDTRVLNEIGLAIERLHAMRNRSVASIGLQLTRIRIVGEVRVK